MSYPGLSSAVRRPRATETPCTKKRATVTSAIESTSPPASTLGSGTIHHLDHGKS